jgi:mannose-6-phosphate isomerase-like protein (cupin superfamily)
MIHIRLTDCREFVAGDKSRLRELLHPGKMQLSIGYSLAHGYVDPGCYSLRHRLRSSEVYYFIAGRGAFTVGDRVVQVTRGDVVYVPPETDQSLVNTGMDPIEFLCLVDPAWKREDEDILESAATIKEPDKR